MDGGWLGGAIEQISGRLILFDIVENSKRPINMTNNTLSGINDGKDLSSREIWPDITRILATFAVILHHAAAAGFYGRLAANSSHFQACNFYNYIARFCVPLFVMLSGMFLLDPKHEYPLKKLYFKKILRLMSAFVIWSIFYVCVNNSHVRPLPSCYELLCQLVRGQFHLWFIFMISGLYMATPILRLIAKDEKMLSYAIILGFIFVFLYNPTLENPKLGTITQLIVNRLGVNCVVGGYVTYFLLGYWLSTHDLDRKKRMVIYILGMTILLAATIFNGVYSIYRNTPGEYVLDNLWADTFFATLAVFVFCQYTFKEKRFSPWMCKAISKMAELSFGIYLIHVFILDHLKWIGLPHFFIHPLFSVPIMSILTFVLSFCAVFVISKIPFLNKYVI